MSGNCKDCRYWQHHVDGYGAAWNECEGVDSTSLEDPVPAMNPATCCTRR